MELSTRLSICIRKDILTNSPPRKGEISSPFCIFVKSSSDAFGGLISMVLFSIVERDVEAEPII